MRNRLYGLLFVAGPGGGGPPFLIGLPHYLKVRCIMFSMPRKHLEGKSHDPAKNKTHRVNRPKYKRLVRRVFAYTGIFESTNVGSKNMKQNLVGYLE